MGQDRRLVIAVGAATQQSPAENERLADDCRVGRKKKMIIRGSANIYLMTCWPMTCWKSCSIAMPSSCSTS
jgi:hypothetical protein